jgi:hypothetical protein
MNFKTVLYHPDPWPTSFSDVAMKFFKTIVPGVEDSYVYHQLEYLRFDINDEGKVFWYGGGGVSKNDILMGPFYGKDGCLPALQFELQKQADAVRAFLTPIVQQAIIDLQERDIRASFLAVHHTVKESLGKKFLGLSVREESYFR